MSDVRYGKSVLSTSFLAAMVFGSVFTVVGDYASAAAFYVNDAYNAAEDVYCTAAGSSGNTGASADSPKSSLQQVLDAYDLESGDTIYVDTGTYTVVSSIVIGTEDSGVTVLGSTHSNGTNFSATSALAAAAVVQVDSADGVELHNLNISGGWVGVQCLDAAGLELVDLTCQYSGWAGILLDGCDAPAVRCATLNTNGFSGIHVSNCSDAVVENTLVCGMPCGIFSDASSATTVCNVTLHRNGWGVWFGNSSTSGQVKNSIIATIRKRSYYGLYVEDLSQSGFQSDCNDHYVTGYANVGYWDGIQGNLSVWQSMSGGDASSLSADPLLVDPDNVDAASRDYCLDSGSPCIDAGDPNNAPSFDIADVARGNRPDIGAHEIPNANESPTAGAGVDQGIAPVSATATLDGTVDDDGLPNPSGSLTTTWTMQSGPGTVTFANANAVDTTATFSEVGTYVLRLTVDDGDLTAYDEVTIGVSDRITLPAKIQAEDFRYGGEGLGYHDTTGGNAGGEYRTDEDVDLYTTEDVDGGYDVRDIESNEWLAFDISVPATGNYSFRFRMNTENNVRVLHVEMDDEDVTGPISCSADGYGDIVASGVSLEAGDHVMKVVFDEYTEAE